MRVGGVSRGKLVRIMQGVWKGRRVQDFKVVTDTPDVIMRPCGGWFGGGVWIREGKEYAAGGAGRRKEECRPLAISITLREGGGCGGRDGVGEARGGGYEMMYSAKTPSDGRMIPTGEYQNDLLRGISNCLSSKTHGSTTLCGNTKLKHCCLQ